MNSNMLWGGSFVNSFVSNCNILWHDDDSDDDDGDGGDVVVVSWLWW